MHTDDNQTTMNDADDFHCFGNSREYGLTATATNRYFCGNYSSRSSLQPNCQPKTYHFVCRNIFVSRNVFVLNDHQSPPLHHLVCTVVNRVRVCRVREDRMNILIFLLFLGDPPTVLLLLHILHILAHRCVHTFFFCVRSVQNVAHLVLRIHSLTHDGS